MKFIDVINRNMYYKMKEIIVKTQDIPTTFRNILYCWAIASLLFLTVLIVATYSLTFYAVSLTFCHVHFQSEKVLRSVDPRFLSLGLDSSVITDGFKNFNMTDPKLTQMMKYLSPAYLRIGGNAADQIIFCSNKENCTLKNLYADFNESYILSGSDWLKLYKLAINANLDVIYDLNSLLRHANGSWDSKNAEEMIRFSGNNVLEVDWELGNEPNSYEHKFNTSVNPTRLGIDYLTLRNILNKYNLHPYSHLVGPSTTRLRTRDIEEYFAEFLISGSSAVSAITWHHYYFSGMNATPREFLDPKVFNYLELCINRVKSIVYDFLQLDKPIWLGETSSAWHGGAPGLSDRFISSFIWIDKLGLSAQKGIDVVVRQSIFKGHYALLNDSYFPNPDWWLSILYKKLVSTDVIGISTAGDEKIRLYAHCAKQNDLLVQDGELLTNSIVVFGVNLQDKSGFVKFEGLSHDDAVYVFEVTSENSLFSQFVRLNGKTLYLLPNLKLPKLEPKIVYQRNVFLMPAYSVVFWVFNNTNLLICPLYK